MSNNLKEDTIEEYFIPIKPWTSFSAQLEVLKGRGMEVGNEEVALSYLERIGYYRLSGYCYPFREYCKTDKYTRKDTFIKDSRFEDVLELYIFDKKLRLLALDALERIEMALRVDIAHLLGEKDPLAHENPECLHGNFAKKEINGKTKHEKWLSKFNSHLSRSKKVSFVKHHLDEYGTLPIWVAIEVWDFGLLSTLFAGMKYNDQQKIAEKYGIADGRKFAQCLRSLNYIRNVSAHHSRLWNVNIVERSSVPQGWSADLDNKRPFLYFCIMKQMLNCISPNSSWGKRLTEMMEFDFPLIKNNAVSLSDFGIITGWKEWDFW